MKGLQRVKVKLEWLNWIAFNMNNVNDSPTGP